MNLIYEGVNWNEEQQLVNIIRSINNKFLIRMTTKLNLS